MKVLEALVELGFPPATELGSLRSIAHLFGTTKPRTGIYALVLPNDCAYIGQAVDVVRRFSQHRIRHEEIVAFSFIAAKVPELTVRELELIFASERAGITLTNVTHATDVTGAVDLDMVMSPEAQDRWAADPFVENDEERITTAPLELSRGQVARFAANYGRYSAHQHSQHAVSLLSMFLRGSIPHPRATEFVFWAVSCMPSTNLATWPRLLCLSAGMMELFVIGEYKDQKNRGVLWGFINVASDVLLKSFGSEKQFRKKFPKVEVNPHRGYRDGGQHQMQLHCPTQLEMLSLLEDGRVHQAAGALALRVMRKRATIYSKYHCKQLADEAFALQAETASADDSTATSEPNR